MVCSATPGVDNLASTLIAYVDCETNVMATRGYGALTTSAGIVPSLLLTLLTLYIAIWGYRLLTGDRPSLAELLPSFVRVAIVLTLASSWPAYQRLVHDVVLQTPAQVAGTVDLSETGRDDGYGLAARLDDVDARFVSLAILGTGAPRTPEEAAFARTNVAPPLFLNFDSFALGSARLVFLVSAIGSFVLVRLLSGALLALGPLIIMFLLFDVTRGVAAGWARALVGLVVAGIVAMLVIDIETMLLAPWLGDLLALRGADQPTYGVAAQLLAATLIFAIVIFAGIRMSRRLAVMVWTRHGARITDRQYEGSRTSDAGFRPATSAMTTNELAQRRAQGVADTITVSDHRRTRLAGAGLGVGASTMTTAASGSGPAGASWTGVASRETAAAQRRAGSRGSASSTRRDRR